MFLNEFETPRDLRKEIADYIKFYNGERPHQIAERVSPNNVYSQFLTRKALKTYNFKPERS
ncbi:IS3 family transposase [Paenibacillus sp. PK1-4R]|uniref:IS3 family transposase n=1 Tax=Paenibacillus sp. PK1-4R TaxID=3049075 RepID=UPI00338FE570